MRPGTGCSSPWPAAFGCRGEFGQVVLSAIRRSAISPPLLPLPRDQLGYASNLIREPPTAGAAEAERLVAANRATYGRVRAAGGTSYPVSAFPLSRDEWRHHLGPAFARLATAKRTHDPDRVLTPGCEVFLEGRCSRRLGGCPRERIPLSRPYGGAPKARGWPSWSRAAGCAARSRAGWRWRSTSSAWPGPSTPPTGHRPARSTRCG